MKIIDAHIHLFPPEHTYGKVMAEAVGHQNNVPHLREVYQDLNIKKAVVMSNQKLSPHHHEYDEDLFHYCIGLDTFVMKGGLTPGRIDKIEANLKRKNCCGVKLYPGYVKLWLTDKMYYPVYELAQTYQKPVAVHMGLTAHPKAHLKYSHPLVLDEVASDFRKTKFVLCHLGNPFLQDTVAVLTKNPNVSTDLSGLLEGPVDLEQYFRDYEGYTKMLKDWLCYMGCWERILFGTDFPIVNYGDYIKFISHLVPEHHWDKVFFENANYVYKLGL
ncbi:MAG: amidohydrolase family protein [Eubacteriales bacterium]